MNIGQNAARLERPNATRQPLTARITRCGPILAIRTEERRHLGRATRRPSRRFCLSEQRPGVKLGPWRVLSDDVEGWSVLPDVVLLLGVRAGAQAYLGPRPGVGSR